MKPVIYVITIILFMSPLCLMADAQKVYMDLDSNIRVIDKDMDEDLELFINYPGFQQACIYKTGDTTYTLEITYLQNQKTEKTTKTMTARELEDFRKKVSDRVFLASYLKKRSMKMNPGIFLYSLGLGVIYYGYCGEQALNSGGWPIISYTLFALGGTFIPYSLSLLSSETDASSSMFISGAIHGITHGALINEAIGSKQGSVWNWGSIWGCCAGSIAGHYIASCTDMSPARGDMMALMGTMGLGLGMGTTALIKGNDKLDALAPVLAALGSGAGYYLGYRMTASPDYTVGDVNVLIGAEIVGALVPLSIVTALEVNDNRVSALSIMTGTAAAYFLGDYLIDGKDFSANQGQYIKYGTMLGGIAGLSLPFTFVPKYGANKDDLLLYGAAGACLGFAASYLYFNSQLQDNSSMSGLNINFNPAGLCSVLMQGKTRAATTLNIPILQLSYKLD